MMTVKRVAVAACPMDEFTGHRVEPGTVRIAMEDGSPGICKENGYVIFWDNGEPSRCLVVDSPYYEPERIVISMADFHKKRSPVLMVWLKPGAAYPYPTGMCFRTEAGQPGRFGKFPMEASEGILSLRGAYPTDLLQPCLIQLKVPEGMELEGRVLWIRRRNDEAGEYFTIWETHNRSMGLYKLAAPLEAVYGVYDSAIRLVLQVKADQAGRLRVPESG